MANLIVLGLLGGIGSGKSTVARFFQEFGAVVLDADAMARAELDREPAKGAILKEFGTSLLDEEGSIDRERLGDIVFRDPERLRRLNGMVHPLVRREVRRRLEELRAAPGATSGAVLVLLDVPLLLESELNALCDRRLFVEAPLELRVERVRAYRGWSGDELERREKNQKSIDEKRAGADYKVINDGALAPVRAQIRAIFQDLISRPGNP
ncbi:MAG: dephospho-CoA kinase [Planctomycetes bacterium]|nr:dephospho-CoA kinase [Planctomycetota bacterium]